MARFHRPIKHLLVSVLAGAALVACGGGDQEDEPVEIVTEDGEVVERSRADARAAQRREEARQRAVADSDSRFTFARYRVDLSGSEPGACFVFSSALKAETDYSPFLEFQDNFRPALTVNGRELCLGGLTFGQDRIATLKSGLPAEDGRLLAEDEDVVISFQDRPTYVGFQGSGVILPRLEADGLPLETVNVDQVKIEVSRVDSRALYKKDINQGQTRQQGRYLYLYGRDGAQDVSEPVWSGTMAIDALRNEPVTTVFPLSDVIDRSKPGAYFVKIEDGAEIPRGEGPAASAARWIMMTDLALTAYRGEDGLDLTLRSLQTGQPVQAAEIELIASNNSVLGEAQTGADGRVGFDQPIMAGGGNLRPRLVVAYGANGDMAVLDLDRAPVDLASDETGGRTIIGEFDGFTYTDRGIYRPGEAVHVTSLLRDRTGASLGDRSGNIIIYRPNGLEATRHRFTANMAGGIDWTYDIPRGSSRGVWRAAVELDGAGQISTTEFSVEDFVPQRIKVELDETASDSPVKAGEPRNLDVDSRFLYGAPGAGLVVQARMRVAPDPSPFDGFEGFVFGQHDNSFRERLISLPDQVTDGEGKTTLRLDPRNAGEGSNRPLRLITVVDVLEPGGRAVSESIRIPYRAQDLYLGVKKEFDYRAPYGEAANFEVAAINSDGEAVSEDVRWKMISIRRHYDWFREAGSGRWRWRRSRTATVVNEGTLPVSADSTGAISVNGLEYGRHELHLETADGVKTSTQFYVGWGGSVGDDGVEAPDRVDVSAPTEAVRVGRDAEIGILPPFDGEAQIVVATDRVLSVQTRPVSKDGTRVQLPVTEEWGEGAYVMVSVYTKRDPLLNAKPRRAVGVTYAPVDMANRTFEVNLKTRSDVVRPGREHMIEVDIEGGPRERVFMTLAAVDEGILQLTKFQSPDPVDYFFGKKALGVSLYDDYGRLLNPNLGLPGEIRTGGDQLGGEGLSVVPTKSVALFSGIVDVGRSGSVEIPINVPDFNGELRLMAVAWSESGLGTASKPLTVRDPVPVELILPRFLAPGDEAIATASIDNVEGEAGSFDASLNTIGSVTTAVSTISRELDQGERGDTPMRIESAGEGISDLTLSVSGPGNININRTYQIETRSAFLPVSRVDRALMNPGDSWSATTSLLDDFNRGSGAVSVSFSRLPVDGHALYTSLARYPYGCTEQTVSRALPLLYSDQLVAENGDLEGAETPRDRVQQALDRVLARQSSDGAFGLWREGDQYASPWLGAYTVDFISRAKEEGYVVPNEVLTRAYTSLRNIAQGNAYRVYGYETYVNENRRWHNDTQSRLMERSSAYALYVLARAGKADVSRMRYLHDSQLNGIDSPLALGHLAAGLAHMGDRARATSAFNAAIEKLGYNNSGDYYQTPLRDLAALLGLAAETGFTDIVEQLAERLGEDVKDPVNLTTQEKAQLLVALNGLSAGEGNIAMTVDGLGRGNNNDRRYMLGEQTVENGVSFTLGGDAPLFRTVIASGSPSSPPPPAREKLTASKQIRSLSGSSVSLLDITQGDQFIISIQLTPSERRTNPVILEDLLPAGFEIESVLRPSDGYSQDGDSGPYAFVGEIDYAQTTQAQDDRFVAAIDVRNEPVTLAYMVRAVTPGEYVFPGVVAEDMYRPDVFARSAARRVAIAARTGAPGGTP